MSNNLDSVSDAGELIDLTTAAAYTANYRSQYGSGPIAYLFGADIINDILEQTGTQGIRFYLGIAPDDTTNTITLVAVGVDADGNDQEDGNIAEMSQICPPTCSTANELNGY